MTDKQMMYVGAAALLGLFIFTRKGVAEQASSMLADATIGVLKGAAVGAVEATGETIGIRRTDDEQCTIDLADGRIWDASFTCPAPRFTKAGIWGDERAEALKAERNNINPRERN